MARPNVFAVSACAWSLMHLTLPTLALAATPQSSANTAPSNTTPTSALDTALLHLRLKQFAQAFTTLQPLANNHDPQAEWLLGNLYRNGLGVSADAALARQWIERAANDGQRDAAYAMAALLSDELSNNSTADSLRNIIQQWLQRAAQAGQPMAEQALKQGLLPLHYAPATLATDASTRRTIFIQAAQQNDLVTLLALLNTATLNASDEFGRSALFHAAQVGNTNVLSELIKAGAELNRSDSFGSTPLMLAASSGQNDSVQQLLSAGAALNAQDRVGNTALMYALGREQRTTANLLITAGANVQLLNSQQWTALDWAVHTNLQDIATQLRAKGLSTTRKPALNASAIKLPLQRASNDLYQGWPDALIVLTRNDSKLLETVNLNSTGPRGESALLIATQAGNTTAIEKLLNSGATVNTDANETPLSWAVRHQQLSLVQVLAKRLDPNLHGKTEDAPLLDAVTLDGSAALPIVEALLRSGASLDTRDAQGRTALMRSVQRKQLALVSRLLASGANPDITDNQGRTALMLAAMIGADDCLRSLVAAKATLDKRDQGQFTALMWAAANGQSSSAELLIAAGASTQPGTSKTTALMLAAAQGNESIIKRLLGAGMKTDAQNAQGETALMFATRAGQLAAVRALVNGGADLALRNNDRATAQDIAEHLALNDIVAILRR